MLAVIWGFNSFPTTAFRFTTNEPQSYVFGGRNHPLHSTSQQSILEKFAKENGFKHTRFFIDDGYSGVTFTRPAFMELMDLAEQGKIGTLIVKDHSRLGRNRLVVGQLLEEDFDRLDVRYIAIMDNIDTDKGLIDLVPMQDLFNEWHAKNTSQKVRNVFRSKGMLTSLRQRWCVRYLLCAWQVSDRRR